MSFQRFSGILAVVFLAARLGAYDVWTNSGSDLKFSNTLNWGTAPANDGTADLKFVPPVIGNPIVDINFSVNSILFDSSLPSFTLQNSGNATLTVASFIEQRSGLNQTIAGPLILGSAFTFKGTSGSSLQLDGSLSGTSGFTVTDGVAVRVAGTWNVTGSITTQNAGRLEFTTGNHTIANAIANDGSIVFGSGANTVAYSGALSGTGDVTINGPTTFSGSNTYTGSTFLTGNATLSDGAAGAFSPNSSIFVQGAGAVLNVNFAETIRGLGGMDQSVGSVTNLTGTLTIKNAGLTYKGTIAGTGGLIITNPGSQTLTEANTYTGGTTINSGTLIVTNTSGSGTGTGAITIANGAMLQLGNGGAGGSVSGDITNNGTVLFASSDTVTYGGVISGSGSLNVGMLSPGSFGTLTLTGANTFTGPTSVSSGTLRIGAVNALPTTGTVGLGMGTTLDVTADQTIGQFRYTYGSNISLAGNATLTVAPAAGGYGGTIESTISGAGGFAFAGAAGTSVFVRGTNTYTGGTQISSGTVFVAGNAALGTGQVTIASGAALIGAKPDMSNSQITLSNPVSLASGATLGGGGRDSVLVIGGATTVPTGNVTVHLQDIVKFSGGIQPASGTSYLTFDSAGDYGKAILTAPADPAITGLTLNTAGVIFGSTASVPTGGFLIKGTNAYVGLSPASGAAPSVASVLALIDKPNFSGVLGFDSPDENTAPATFADTIDLSGFGSSVMLGSGTGAVLTGTILPSSSGYLFGNGGGYLVVTSALTGANDLTISSQTGLDENDLITVLRGNNTFTGAVSVTNSALVLDSATALLAGKPVTLGANGYLGYTEAYANVSSFSEFVQDHVLPGTYTGTSIIGLDSNAAITSVLANGTAAGRRYVSDTIDLRALGPIGLGTLTTVTIDGPIYAPTQGGAAQTLTLVPRKDGELEINSDLVAGQVNAVVVGSDDSEEESAVVLNGANTYAGGTKLLGGQLVVGRSSEVAANGSSSGALGTGALEVSGTAEDVSLVAGAAKVSVANTINLGSRLRLGQPTNWWNSTSTSTTSRFVGNWLMLTGAITELTGGAGGLDVFGNVYLGAANSFSGGVTHYEGSLMIDDDQALGTASSVLRWAPGRSSAVSIVTMSTSGSRTIANPLVYDGTSRGTVYFSGGDFTFNGALTLNTDAVFAPSSSERITFNGNIGGMGRFVGGGSGTILLGGNNTMGNGIESQSGTLILTNAGAIPSAPGFGALTANGTGYIGIQFVPANLQSTFIDRFNKGGTTGTIGFDSASVSSPNTFAGSIDLSFFNANVRLGSTSAAILTGSITPFSDVYRFGNGGGFLDVRSNLVDGAFAPRRLELISFTPAPLTLRLGGTNTFSGGITVVNSGLILGTGALPASGTLSVTNGYIGTEDAAHASTPGAFIGRFDSNAVASMVGFDGLNVSGAIALGTFTSTTDPEIYLGTATSATLSGAISLPGAQPDYRFAGFKGGQLTVQSVLSDGAGARGVVIGDEGWDATFAAPRSVGGPVSTVTLAGNNTFTGGTSLEAGALYVAHDNALGTGVLTVGDHSYDGHNLALLAAGGARTLQNGIVLGSGTLDLGGDDNLTLTGSISGMGGFAKVGNGTLTLSGSNSFSGFIEIGSGIVAFDTTNSVGSGLIEFTDSVGKAIFRDHVTLSALSGGPGNTVQLTAGKTFTLSLSDDAYFGGDITGATAGFIVNGSGTKLHLAGTNTFTGATTIQNGTVFAGTANAFGVSSNAVTVAGGSLAVGAGVLLTNPISITAGELEGAGTFKAVSGSSGFAFTSGIGMKPGLGGTGVLTFDGSLISTSVLILGGGGYYDWELMDATNTTTGWDLVRVTNGTVNITATTAAPFTFSLYTVDASGGQGWAANFDTSRSYTWTVLTTSGGILGFSTPAQFVIDSSGFLNWNSGTFALDLSADGKSLLLNFNPVPEPSTYALMLAGVGALVLGYRRKRTGKR